MYDKKMGFQEYYLSYTALHKIILLDFCLRKRLLLELKLRVSMSKGSEKFRPVAPPSDCHFSSDDKKAAEIRRMKRWCCIGALLLIVTVVGLTLAFTVFSLKYPIVRVGKLNFDSIEFINGSNMTLNVDVLVKNPNLASFRYGNMTTTFFYRGAVVGDLRGPAGWVKAWRTVRFNVTVDIMKDRILSRPGLEADMYSGLVNVSSYTRVCWRMHLLMFEKHMRMKMKCNLGFNITSRAIQHHICKRNIKF